MALEELDFDYRMQQSAEADKNLAVRFYLEPLPVDGSLETEGRLLFTDVEFVEIRVRGDRNNCVQRPARKDDQVRWRDAYRAFKAGEEESITGTPLKEWPSISRAMLEELKYMGFFTVEQLASASDSVCSKFSGLTTYKQKAQNFLKYAKEAAPIEALQKIASDAKNSLEVAERNQKEMAEQISKLTAQVEALQKRK